MGIDYVVELDCAPKRALSTKRIISLIKGQSQVAAIIERARRQGDQRPQEEITFTRMLMRPEGTVREEVSVGELLKQGEELQPHAHHCQACQANLRGKPYGCYGSISYPITVRAEEWLMSLLPNDLVSPAGHLLRSAVTDFKYTGGMFLQMRQKDIFFESRKPVVRNWGSSPSTWTLISDQVLQMLFGLGNLQPSHCKMMCIILGLIPTGAEAQPLPQPSPNDQTEQFAHAINAVGLAGELGVNLLVDA